MNELQIFENEQFGTVRTVLKDGETWFVAADVCRVFGVMNSRNVTARLDDDEKGAQFVDTLGGQQMMTIVNEAGLYHMLFTMEPNNARGIGDAETQQRIEKLRAFKRWITHEVIPAIRAHGGYLTTQKIEEALLNPDTLIRLAQDLKQERAQRLEAQAKSDMLEERARADAPKVRFAEAVENAKDDILIGEMAQILAQNGVKTGEKRLFETLRKDGYLKKSKGADWNMPTQRSIELGVMRIVKRTVTLPNGCDEIRRTTKITGKGQAYFLQRYADKAAQ